MAIIKIIPFLILAVIIVFGSHYFLYFSFVKFFAVQNLSVKFALLSVLLALPIIFVVSSAFSHSHESGVIDIFYALSASWIGIALNFLLAACLVWILIGTAGWIGFQLNAKIISLVVLSLAILFSIHGFWNTFNPRIKNIDVHIKNLPAEWEGKKIIQLSDVHLGHIHGPKFLRDVMEKSNAENPDLVLITGDLFDGMDGDLNTFVEFLKNIQAKKGVFFVTGNHETYIGLDKVLPILKAANIKILDNELVDFGGLQIIGASYDGEGSFSPIGKLKNTAEILASLENFDKTKPSILLHHAPTDIDAAKAGGISLQLSGHAHAGQIFPIRFISRLVYGKYYYGFYREGDFSIYTTSGTGTWGPPMRTGNLPEIVSIKLWR